MLVSVHCMTHSYITTKLWTSTNKYTYSRYRQLSVLISVIVYIFSNHGNAKNASFSRAVRVIQWQLCRTQRARGGTEVWSYSRGGVGSPAAAKTSRWHVKSSQDTLTRTWRDSVERRKSSTLDSRSGYAPPAITIICIITCRAQISGPVSRTVAAATAGRLSNRIGWSLYTQRTRRAYAHQTY